ncbi:hypothetical protein [Salinigranum marinum]|uniref:hypothetical protein n=1 Tax=Salinigranum marinum TaxID=1515595 RepID=UPI002989E471|nr:hypothetical protein [Salinigranum marinum]
MRRHTGDLHLLTIATIFLVVFAAIWGGVQHSRGQLLPDDRIDAGEQRVRDALWTRLAEWRAAEGLQPAQRAQRSTLAAQTIANASITGPSSIDGTPAGIGSGRCSQLLVRHTVADPRWADATRDGTPTPAVADAVAGELFSALVAADDTGLLRRTGTFWTAIGVAADGDELVVVYRSCTQRRLSP